MSDQWACPHCKDKDAEIKRLKEFVKMVSEADPGCELFFPSSDPGDAAFHSPEEATEYLLNYLIKEADEILGKGTTE